MLLRHKFMFLNLRYILLLPFSFLFGMITFIRHKLYDYKILSSVKYDDIFVISVGNITVGGTGKTPFVEYLLQELSPKHSVAVLSRGYKRTTRGFLFVDDNISAEMAGDEPSQIKQKFKNITVAVDVDRVRGIEHIREKYPATKVIILDDAFQYRKIIPNLSILLVDYNRPLYRDSMLPGGNLREWTIFAKRADIMVISKTPENFSAIEQSLIKERYAKICKREIFFTTIQYGDPMALFSNAKELATQDIAEYAVLLISGIANPKPFQNYIGKMTASVQTMAFEDHHAYTEKDALRIVEKWNNIQKTKKILLTTEKDAVRLKHILFPETIAKRVYYIPIEVKIINQEKIFKNEQTLSFI